MRTLLLNPWYIPHKILRWQDAVTLIFRGIVDVIVEYDEDICSPSISIKAPAVLRLKKPIRSMKNGVRFSRIGVYLRDNFNCQYCGEQFSARQLSFDHVVPRKSGGRTEWTNIVTACKPCNCLKGDKTCDDSGMFPIKKPVRPQILPYRPPHFGKHQIPVEWHDFCHGLMEIL
jgi:5-methylcytosine-specific restriction endonuclease McrA